MTGDVLEPAAVESVRIHRLIDREPPELGHGEDADQAVLQLGRGGDQHRIGHRLQSIRVTVFRDRHEARAAGDHQPHQEPLDAAGTEHLARGPPGEVEIPVDVALPRIDREGRGRPLREGPERSGQRVGKPVIGRGDLAEPPVVPPHGVARRDQLVVPPLREGSRPGEIDPGHLGALVLTDSRGVEVLGTPGADPSRALAPFLEDPRGDGGLAGSFGAPDEDDAGARNSEEPFQFRGYWELGRPQGGPHGNWARHARCLVKERRAPWP